MERSATNRDDSYESVSNTAILSITSSASRDDAPVSTPIARPA